MLPFALYLLITCTLALPTSKIYKRAYKPECPTSTLQQPADDSITEGYGLLNAAISDRIPGSLPSASRLSSLLALDDGGVQLDPLPGCNLTIPVQFNNYHVADSTLRTDGYISDELFNTALTRLNTNYAADETGITFTLLRINRIPMTPEAWNALVITSEDVESHTAMGREIKGSNPARSEVGTLHVTIVNDADACGFTYLPVASWSSASVLRDAVVLDTKCFDGSEQFRSTTLTHEVGHWLGLYHTFEGGCTGDGDFVLDTPPAVAPVNDPTSLYDDCTTPAPTTSCGSSNATDIYTSLRNFMSYSTDECRVAYTPGQIDRMHAVLSVSRGFPDSC